MKRRRNFQIRHIIETKRLPRENVTLENIITKKTVTINTNTKYNFSNLFKLERNPTSTRSNEVVRRLSENNYLEIEFYFYFTFAGDFIYFI